MGYLNVFAVSVKNRERMRTFLYSSLTVLFYSRKKELKHKFFKLNFEVRFR